MQETHDSIDFEFERVGYSADMVIEREHWTSEPTIHFAKIMRWNEIKDNWEEISFAEQLMVYKKKFNEIDAEAIKNSDIWFRPIDEDAEEIPLHRLY